jgi:hypothetical protein
MHQQFNVQQLYALPTLYLCVLYLSKGPEGAMLLGGRSRDRSPVVSLGIFSEVYDKSMCPGSAQHLKMSTRAFLGVKAAGA